MADRTGPQLRIREDGSWFWGEEEITHPGVRKLFASHLAWRESGGPGGAAGYWLELDGQARPVVVEDAPLVVAAIEEEAAGAGELKLILKDGRRLPFPPGEIILRGDLPYTSLARPLDTRFSRSAYWQLAQHLEETGDDYRVNWAGRSWPVRVLEPGET